MRYLFVLLSIFLLPAVYSAELPGFRKSPHFDEQLLEFIIEPGIAVHMNAPAAGMHDPARPTLLTIYALPNGNSTEWTIGAELQEGMDWHFDIQHIGAQVRRLREVDDTRNHVVAYVEAEGRSWPGWRQKHAGEGDLIRGAVEEIRSLLPGDQTPVALVAHSGGGSFIFGFINAVKDIPPFVERIGFLDANYGFRDEQGHGEKLIDWLQGDSRRHLHVQAYDDRNIMIDGKLVVSPTGGTWRATHRMVGYFEPRMDLLRSHWQDFDCYYGMGGQLVFLLHVNKENEILHTRLIGEMNGFLQAMTFNTPWETKWGRFGGPRAYTAWVQKPDSLQLPSAP